MVTKIKPEASLTDIWENSWEGHIGQNVVWVNLSKYKITFKVTNDKVRSNANIQQLGQTMHNTLLLVDPDLKA